MQPNMLDRLSDPAVPLTYTDRVATLFGCNEGRWLHWTQLAAVGGALAWRTRVSDCRRLYRMPIDNKVERDPSGTKQSFYRYQEPR